MNLNAAVIAAIIMSTLCLFILIGVIITAAILLPYIQQEIDDQNQNINDQKKNSKEDK